MINEIIKAIVKHTLEREVSFSGANIIIDGNSYTKATWGDVIGDNILSEGNIKLYAEYVKNHRRVAQQKSIWNNAYIKLRELYLKEMSGGSSEVPEVSLEVQYIPLVNIITNETILMYPKDKVISEMSYEAWTRSLGKEEKMMMEQSIQLAKFIYDPYDISTLVPMSFDGGELLKINLYLPPKWREKENNYNEEIPESIETILRHLFVGNSYEYVLDWLYHTLINRNETYLVLNGAKGVGKGIFSSITKMLVGQENYIEAPDSLLDTQFNSALDKKRVIVFDEFVVKKGDHTKLKRYINKYQNIEKKGKDADKSTEIFNSYIISNNDESDMYLESDDRRFSVVDLTETNLTKLMTEEEISELVKEIEDNEDLAREFGYFIYNRGEVKYSRFHAYKGEKYDRLVMSSLKTWQKLIVEKLLEGEDMLELKRLRKEAKKAGNNFFPTHTTKIVDFLKNFRQEDERLGELVKEEGDWYIKSFFEDTVVEADLL